MIHRSSEPQARAALEIIDGIVWNNMADIAEEKLDEIREWAGEIQKLLPQGDAEASPNFFSNPGDAPKGWKPNESLGQAVKRQVERLQEILREDKP